MSEEFLEKRRRALDSYLQTLLNPELWEKNAGVKDYVMKFLAKGMWEKHKSDLARKVKHRKYLFFPMKDRNLFHRVDTIGNIFSSGAAKKKKKILFISCTVLFRYSSWHTPSA